MIELSQLFCPCLGALVGIVLAGCAALVIYCACVMAGRAADSGQLLEEQEE